MQAEKEIMSTTKQRQKIGFWRKSLGLDDETYQDMLSIQYGVLSSKDLTLSQAEEFAYHLKSMVKNMGLYKPNLNNALASRPGMATSKQIYKINAMWHTVTVKKDEKEIKTALRRFLKRIVGVNDLNFLKIQDVSKVIRALEQMQKQKRGGIQK